MKPESDFPPQYNPSNVEPLIRALWDAHAAFKPENGPNTTGKRFVVAMPPPNVTGTLHIGHALTATIEDILVRYHRMKGDETLWIPGTDHAGIATQAVVERQLQKEGTSRLRMGREKFLERVWEWKQAHGQEITNQHKMLGVSTDWSRERFTLDEHYKESVTAAFKTLKERELIFQGEYLVNWCPKDRTAISDDEVEYREEEGTLYYIKYQIENLAGQYITVATTRPETLLGDVAVAVHPDDPRYKKLHNATLVLPIANRPIPVITDKTVERGFGTGAVKVTPAHDKRDFELGGRHKLPMPKILDAAGCLCGEIPQEYEGLKVAAAREKILAELKEQGLLEKTQKLTHSVGHCYRCGATIEPLLSEQWFVDLPKLVERTGLLSAIQKDQIEVIPKRFKKVAIYWLQNIRPWCISRQLWWGHPIPGETSGDVLDTWFSSALWPFATLGWPREGADYAHFYPTTLLETGYDLLFFWVLRMLLMGKELTGEWPFTTIYFHGLVRDKEGRKMSKSVGNVIDPLTLTERFGTDALRMGLVAGTTPGNDQKFSESKVVGYRNFSNKIWNITRFIVNSVHEVPKSMTPAGLGHHLPDEFGAARAAFDALGGRVTGHLEHYRLSRAAEELYEYVWHTFADKVLEEAKPYLKESHNPATAQAVSAFLLALWGDCLALLHPFVPFVSEACWERLGHQQDIKPLVITPWPQKQPSHKHIMRVPRGPKTGHS